RVHAAQPLTPGRPLCCGRTCLSAGLAEQAKAEARRTLQALKPWVERGAAVIGLEPSCLLTFRDEFRAMAPGSEALARHSFLFEEFIARELDAGHFSVSFAPMAKTALLHGHCHQKAFDAMPAVTRVLKLIPQLKVEAVESSCCGMAGSFGYEAEREIAEKAVGLAAELGDEAKHAIADEKQRRHLPARARLGREPPKQREEREPLQRELVELRRMTRRLARAAKYHPPRQVRNASVELPVDEVPQPACRDAERTQRRDEIHQPQETQLVAARRERHGEDDPEQAAVEGHPALPYREDLERV